MAHPRRPFDQPGPGRAAARRRRDLRAITGDGIAFSVMVGAGETYVPAFALAMGLGETTAGWLVSLPLLAGAVIQMVSPTAVKRLGSLRTWVVACALVQALTMAGYTALALAGRAPAAALFAVTTLYWASGLATGPAWNTWVGRLVPRRLRPRFFARRSRLAQLAVLTGLVGAGLALHAGERRGSVVHVFALLFAAAAVARGLSAGFLASQREPLPPVVHRRRISLRSWLSRRRGANDGRLLLYMLAVQAAVQVAGPFFTPYMLGELRFDYLHYLVLIGTSFLTKMLVLPAIGDVVHRLGARTALIAAAFGIVPMSGLWIVSDAFVYLLCIQVVSGAVWAVYELTTFLLLFDHIDESERTGVLTIYNLANALTTVGGALLGGAVLHLLAEGHVAYVTVFGLSSALRLLAIPLVLRIGRIPVEHYGIAVRPLGVRPNSGSLDAPIVTSMEEQKTEGP